MAKSLEVHSSKKPGYGSLFCSRESFWELHHCFIEKYLNVKHPIYSSSQKIPMLRENVGIFRDHVMLCNSLEHVSFERKLLSTEIRKKQTLKISTQWKQLNAYILGD